MAGQGSRADIRCTTWTEHCGFAEEVQSLAAHKSKPDHLSRCWGFHLGIGCTMALRNSSTQRFPFLYENNQANSKDKMQSNCGINQKVYQDSQVLRWEYWAVFKTLKTHSPSPSLNNLRTQLRFCIWECLPQQLSVMCDLSSAFSACSHLYRELNVEAAAKYSFSPVSQICLPHLL